MEVDETGSSTRRVRLTAGWLIVLGATIFVVGGGIALLLVPGPLLDDWVPNLSPSERGKLLGPAAQIVLLCLGGVIAVVGVSLSLARHREELAANERDRQRLAHDQAKEMHRIDELDQQRRVETERELRGRFVTAVDLLSDGAAPIRRQAALYALGALADDWAVFARADEVQVCIDVIASYLRTPAPPAVARAPDELAVRQTGYGILRSHLARGAAFEWGSKIIDLRGANINLPVDLGEVVISSGGSIILEEVMVEEGASLSLRDAAVATGGRIGLKGATIRKGGSVSLRGLRISLGAEVDATQATITGELDLSGARVEPQGDLGLSLSSVEAGGRVNLGATTVQGSLRLTNMRIAGNVQLDAAGVSGSVGLDSVKVSDGGVLSLFIATIAAGGSIRLRSAEIAHGGAISCNEIRIEDGGRVEMDGVKLRSGGEIVFDTAVVEAGATLIVRDALVEHGSQVAFANSEIAGQIDLRGTKVQGTIDFQSAGLADAKLILFEPEGTLRRVDLVGTEKRVGGLDGGEVVLPADSD